MLKGPGRHNNFIYLTVALVLLLLSSAVLDSVPPGIADAIFRSLLWGTLVVGYLSLDFGKIWRHFTAALLIALALSVVLEEWLASADFSMLQMSILLVFFCGEACFAARQVLFSGAIDANTIIGALAIYLLLGLIWSLLYLMSIECWPNALNGIEHRSWGDNFNAVTFFSYVTLVSLGYGDITPAVPVSRVLAFLEAICGAFYMAVVVASLVSARISIRAK